MPLLGAELRDEAHAGQFAARAALGIALLQVPHGQGDDAAAGALPLLSFLLRARGPPAAAAAGRLAVALAALLAGAQPHSDLANAAACECVWVSGGRGTIQTTSASAAIKRREVKRREINRSRGSERVCV